MKILLAKHSGFCVGVRRAVETAFSMPPENTFVLGELIHNGEVVARLKGYGIVTVNDPDEVPRGANLLIRSHGVGKDVYRRCSERGLNVIDCTCSFVQRTQRIVEEASKQGKIVVIAGDKGHPEVKGLVGWCETECRVVSSPQEDFSFVEGKDVVLVAQTTFFEQTFCEIAENLKKGAPKTVEIFKTICYTTVCRQEEAARLAARCDAVLVVGGLNSGNTKRLSEIASEYCSRVYRVERADGFEYEKINFLERVGVIAGASTPDWLTQEVLSKMAENKAEVQETTPVVEEIAEEVVAPEAAEEVAAPAEEPVAVETPAEEPAPAPAEAPAPAKEPKAPKKPTMMEQAVADFDKNERYRKGQVISANIVSATDEGIYVSASGKLEILLAKEDIDCEEYSRDAYAARVGEEIRLMVVELVPKVKVSEKAVRKIIEEEAVLKEIEDGKEFTVVCTGFNKGGLTAELGTYPVFIPAREIRSGYVKDLEKYKGKTLRLKVIEIRKERRKEIIASQRVILEAEREAREAAKAEKEAAFFDSIQVDDIVDGKVERVTSFGAFVSVGGFDCLAHISDLSWSGVKQVTDVLEIGKHYEFKVLKIDRDSKKVSLGYKQLQPQPWDLAAEKYAEGDVVHGKIVRIVPFGAFVEIEKGVDGLVHVSQISHEWLENPTAALKIGDEIDAKIIAFNPAARKITLSIKALIPQPEVEHEPRHEREEGSAPRRPRKNSRKGHSNPESEEGEEYTDWTEESFSGVSISELLGSDSEDK